MRRCFVGSLFCMLIVGSMGVGCKRNTPPPKPRAERPKAQVSHGKLPLNAKVYPEEVVLQAGTFTMGSPETEAGRLEIEGPHHQVTLHQVIVMGRHEVTQDRFRRVMGYNPSIFQDCGGRCPVENVSWHEAAVFCNKLSIQRGLTTCFRCTGKGKHSVCNASPEFRGSNYYRCPGYRLPTEAEWEYAARAGEDGPHYEPVGPKAGALQTIIDRISWYGQNSFVIYKGAHACANESMGHKGDDAKAAKVAHKCGPKHVGQKQPNRRGLYDTLGNVSEWVYDHFGKYSPEIVKNPAGPAGGLRVFRGCNWFQMPRECRLARRFWASPAVRNHTLGLRVARTLGLLSKEK